MLYRLHRKQGCLGWFSKILENIGRKGKFGNTPIAIQRHLSKFRKLTIWDPEDVDGIVGYFDGIEEGLIW